MAVGVEPKDEVEQADDDAPGLDGPRAWSKGKIIGLALAVVAVGAMLVVVTQPGDAPSGEESPTAQSGPSGYETFVDPLSGFSLERPETWVPISRPEGSQRLVLTAGGQSSVSVRFEPDFTGEPITTVEDLAQLQAVTDRIAGGGGAQVVNRQALSVNELPTIYYLSRFTDEASGVKGVNAQYFIFQGTDMYTLLFQAVPELDFDRLAPEFDKILASFQGDPDYQAPETQAPPAPPTSAAG